MALTAKDQQAIATMIAAAINPPATPASKPATAGRKAHKPATATAARKPRKTTTPATCITAGQAWVALGGAADFEPRDLDKPANNAQLWKLNAAGLLALSQ